MAQELTLSREEALAEGYRRGILSPDMKGAYEEALKRGILTNPLENSSKEAQAVSEPPVSTEKQLANISFDNNPISQTNAGQGWQQGLQEAGQGIKQLALQAAEKLGLTDNGAAQNYTKQVEQQRADFEKSPAAQSTMGNVGRFAGGAAPLTALAVATGGTSIPAMAALGALSGATQFVPSGESRAQNTVTGGLLGSALPLAGKALGNAGKAAIDYLSPKIGETAAQSIVGGGAGGLIGAGADAYNGEDNHNFTAGLGLLGAGSPIIAKGLGSAVGKIYNSIQGNLSTPEQQRIVDLGDKFGIPIFAADASPNSPVLGSISKYAEDIPGINTSGNRLEQMQAASAAAQGLSSKLQNEMISTQYGGKTGLSRLEQTSQSNSPRAASAQSLLNEVNNAGDDWNKIIQASGDVRALRSKLIADDKYDKVAKMADNFGGIPKNNTLEAIDGALKDAQTSVLPDKSLINTLQTLRDNVSSNDMNFSQMRSARSDLSALINDYYKGSNAIVGSKGANLVQGVKSAIEKDMNGFAQNNGSELKTAWQNADNFYKNAVIPYKDSQLAKALRGSDADEIYSKFIKTGGVEGDKGTGRATRFYDALDSKGQAAVRYGMMKQALENSTNSTTGAFSPAQFAGSLERIGAAKGVFFQGAQKQEIDGFTNLMRHVERSGQMNKPETGVRTIPILLGALGVGESYRSDDPLGTAGKFAVGAYGLKKLMTTNAGRSLLLSSSKLPPASPQMQQNVSKIIDFLQKGAIVGGTQIMNRRQ